MEEARFGALPSLASSAEAAYKISLISDFSTSAFGPYTAWIPLSFFRSPSAPSAFHAAISATFPGSFTVTRSLVMQASTRVMFSLPPRSPMIRSAWLF